MDTSKILADLRAEQSRIEQAIAALEALDGSGPTTRSYRRAVSSVKPAKRTRRRRMSAAGRKRISEMMKRRWAERRKKAATA